MPDARYVPPAGPSTRARACGRPARPECRPRWSAASISRGKSGRSVSVPSGPACSVDAPPAMNPSICGSRRASATDFAFGAAQQQRRRTHQFEHRGHRDRVFGVGVAADDHRRPGAGVHQLDQAVAGVAQADDAAHVQQALQARAQQLGGDEGRFAGRDGSDRGQGVDAQRLQHCGTTPGSTRWPCRGSAPAGRAAPPAAPAAA